jgi:MFS family permease
MNGGGLTAKRALRFVLTVGIVNLFADLTYEGARGVAGSFLGHLGANGAMVGIVAGGGELAGYLVRSVSGAIADRTGRYWINAWVGYAINMLCVPALALAGSWPAAAGLLVGERIGRGIRKPVVAAMLAEAGQHLGSGRAFGINETLDQVGATAGPLLVAFAIARGGYSAGFGVLLVPALLTLAALGVATFEGRAPIPHDDAGEASSVLDWPALRRYAAGGALFAAGYVDFALIAFRFARDDVMSVPAISISFAAAMATGAIAAPLLGRLFDRMGRLAVVIALALAAFATPLAFLGEGAVAQAGAALWGVGIAIQDALLLALVAGVVRKNRATAFGLYDLVFGIAWFAGSVVCGVLLDRSIAALVVFSTFLQLCAIPFFAGPARRTTPG